MVLHFKNPHLVTRWTEIEKCLHGYRSEPYLSENVGGSNEVRIWDVQQTSGESKDSSNSGSHSVDLTIEKHIFFDTFLKRLELMNIVHTAFWKTAEILKVIS